MASVPPWVGHASAVDDRDRYVAMTPEERLAVFVDVCELARTILESRPDRRTTLAENEAMPAAAAATWERLVAEARGGRPTR